MFCVGGAYAQGDPRRVGGGVRDATAAAGGGRGGRRAGQLGARGARPRRAPRDRGRRRGPVGRELPREACALPAGIAQTLLVHYFIFLIYRVIRKEDSKPKNPQYSSL